MVKIVHKDSCDDIEAGELFEGMPMNRPLSEDELNIFKDKITKKNKMIGELYQKPGLARKIRLSNDSIHTNSRNYGRKGFRCILCHYILKEENGTSTTKGCETCCVPLCSASSSKFKNPKELCEYMWHNVLDLKSFNAKESMTKKANKTKIVDSVQGAVDSLSSLNTRRNVRRRMR